VKFFLRKRNKKLLDSFFFPSGENIFCQKEKIESKTFFFPSKKTEIETPKE
jgi:hypothetical protein